MANRDRLADGGELRRHRADAGEAGLADRPVPGYDVRILDERRRAAGTERGRRRRVRLPLPPGALPTLWGDDARFVESYLGRIPGFYPTGDGGYLDEDGYLFVMGRDR